MKVTLALVALVQLATLYMVLEVRGWQQYAELQLVGTRTTVMDTNRRAVNWMPYPEERAVRGARMSHELTSR